MDPTTATQALTPVVGHSAATLVVFGAIVVANTAIAVAANVTRYVPPPTTGFWASVWPFLQILARNKGYAANAIDQQPK